MMEILFSDYTIHLLILICIYAMLTQSFNLTFGQGRLFNLAHIAGYAVGGYTTAILTTQHEFGFWSCLVLSGVLSGIFALLVGAISARLTSDYFAIGTIAFSYMVSALLINWKSLTRGVLGIPAIPRPEIGGIDFYNNANFLILIFTVLVIILIFYGVLMRSSFSRVLRAQAESEWAALALGKATGRARAFAFSLASATAGIAGSFFAFYLNYIDPSSFSFAEMVFVLTIVVVGKPGSYWGVLGATIFLVLLPEPLRFLNFDSSQIGPMRQLIHSVILFLVVYWKRATLFPVERKV